MYAMYGTIYHQYTPNVSIYTIHGSSGEVMRFFFGVRWISHALHLQTRMQCGALLVIMWVCNLMD